MKEQKDAKRNMAARAAFTLMEIMVAVAIIGILGTTAVVAVKQQLDKARLVAAQEGVNNLESAILTYQINYKKLPSSLDDLVQPYDGDQPIVRGGAKVLEDPWGHKYQYERNGRDVVVISGGPDESIGTDDDIRSDKVK